MSRQTLKITPGLQQDDTDYSVGRGGFIDVNNVRPWKGEMEIVGGWESATLSKVTGVCRSLHSWTNSAGELLTAFGTHTGLFVLVGGTLLDITPLTGFTPGEKDGLGGSGYGTGAYNVGAYSTPSTNDYFPLTWSLDNYGDKLIANPRGQTIFEWDEGNANAIPLLNAPAKVTYSRVSETRQIMAYGCNEEISGLFNPRAIRFSDIEGITTWATTTNNNAGEYILEGSGLLVSARGMGFSAFVFTDSRMYLETYTGLTDKPFDYASQGKGGGLVGPNAVAILGQTAYWLSPDFKFWSAVLGAPPRRVVSPIASTLAGRLAPVQQDKIMASALSEFGEVWFFYQSVDGTDVDSYVAASTLTGSWFKGDIGRSAFIDASPAEFAMGVSVAGDIYWHEKGHSADGGALSWAAETGEITMSNAGRVLNVKGFWPDFKGQIGAVSLTINTRFFPQGDETAYGPFSISPGQTKLDFLLNAQFMQFKFSGSSTPAKCRFGNMNFDMQVGSGQ